METLFNIDEDGSLVISEYGWSPDNPIQEVRVPARELPALRAILSKPALASCETCEAGAYFNDLSIIANEDGITLEQTVNMGMGGRDSKVELSPAQIWPAIHEMARLASSWEWTSTGEARDEANKGNGES